MATAKKKPAKKAQVWRATVGLTRSDGGRFEPGDEVPDEMVAEKWLVEQGLIVKGDG